MKITYRLSFALACSLATLGACAASPVHSPDEDAQMMQSPHAQAVLRAMSYSSTVGHPDQYGEFNGMQRYAAGNYKAAMKYFRIGARFADKLSQLSIGLMYLNGEGVEKDPVTAFAWIAMAAERNYPAFLATRDAVWAQLDAAQREQAKAKLEQLYSEFGDPTAKRRMTLRLRWGRSELTGSYLGFASDSVFSMTPAQLFQGGGKGGAGMPPCGADTIAGSVITGCGNLQTDERWNPKTYFQARDGQWKATVKVGSLEKIDPAQIPLQQPDRQSEIQ